MTTITRLTTRTILGVGALFLTYAEPSSSQEIDGDWRGSIDVMDQTLPFVVHFATTDGILNATIDIQGATGLALQNVSYEAPTVHFELPAGPGLAVWDGEVDGDSVAGTFTQAGISGTFTMSKFSSEDSSTLSRAPAPYDAKAELSSNSDIARAVAAVARTTLYSDFSASTGSTRLARLAGDRMATTTTARSNPVAPTKATGSPGSTS